MVLKIVRADYLQLIENSVKYIESNLAVDLNREDIAGKVGMSKYHFHRIFKSMVGESPCDYLIKRRLTQAAHKLIYTDDRIIDIALEYNYGSQEAFTRAFKARFGVTPGEYRKIGQPLVIERPPLTPRTLQHLQAGFTLEPQIMERPELYLIGARKLCTLPFNDDQLIHIWDYFLAQTDKVIRFRQQPSPKFIGVYEHLPSIGGFYNSKYCYMAAISTDSDGTLPNGIIGKVISAGKYALFTCKDLSLSRLEIHRYIHSAWLPNSAFKRDERDILVEFKGIPMASEYNIFIPIK